MPNFPKLNFTLDLLNQEWMKSINNSKKANFEKYHSLNLKLIKQLNHYHLLITDPDFSVKDERYIKHAQLIQAQLQTLNEALKNTFSRPIAPPKNYWSYFFNIQKNFRETAAKRFVTLKGEFSEETLPHAHFFHSNDFLFVFFCIIGISFLVLEPALGLTIAFAIISALLLASICATIISITVHYRVDHAIEKERFELYISELEKKITPRAKELESINLSLETLMDQLEEDYITNYLKNDLVINNSPKPEDKNSKSKAERPSQVGMFKPITEKEREEGLKQVKGLILMGY